MRQVHQKARTAWEGRAEVKMLPDGTPHMPDFGPILEREIADKRLISRSFGSAGSTYDGEASIQHEVARHLAALWETAGPAEGPVVEFGTGTGYLTSLISRTGRPMRLYDIVPVMDGVVRADSSRTENSASRTPPVWSPGETGVTTA